MVNRRALQCTLHSRPPIIGRSDVCPLKMAMMRESKRSMTKMMVIWRADDVVGVDDVRSSSAIGIPKRKKQDDLRNIVK